MDAFELAENIENSEEFRDASFEGKLQMRSAVLSLLKQDPRYYTQELSRQGEIDKGYLTRPMAGLDGSALVEGDDVDRRSAQFLEQATSARDTGVSTASFGDGFTETFSDYLTGKVGAWAVDLFTSGDTTDYLYGDGSDEYKKYRDFIFDELDPEGIGDFKAGKVLGHVTGFGSDAAISSALYGSVGAPGLITKAFGGFGSQVAQRSVLSGVKGFSAMAPQYLGQLGVETFGYLGETLVADAITGELSANKNFNEYIGTIPSTLGKGAMYFTIGEAFGGAMQGLGKVFTRKGLQGDEFFDIASTDQGKLLDDLVSFARLEDGSEEALIATLRSGDLEDAQINGILEKVRDARIYSDPNLKPEELEKNLLKTFYGVETTKVGDGYSITSYGGEPLPAPLTVASGAELQNALRDLNIDFKNKVFNTSSKFWSDMTGNVELSVKTYSGEQTLKMNPTEVSAVFRPSDGATNASQLEGIVKAITDRPDVEIRRIDDYFTRDIRTRADRPYIYVPSRVDNAEQASKFAQQFFRQAKVLGTDVEMDTRQIEAMLRGTSNIKYDREFLDLIVGPRTFKVIDEKLVGKIGGQKMSFDTVEAAAKAAHKSLYTEVDLNKALARDKGLIMQYKKGGEGVVLLDAKSKKVVKEVDNWDDLFDDVATRPALPFEMRSDFVAFKRVKESPAEVNMFTTGQIKDVVAKGKQYANSPSYNVDRKATQLGKVSYDPKFKKIEVTLKDSGITETFDSMKAAQSFLEKDFTLYKEIEETAFEKGYRVVPNTAGYSIITDGADPVYARDLDSLAKQVGNLQSVTKLKDTFEAIPVQELKRVEVNLEKEALPYLNNVYEKQVSKQLEYKGTLEKLPKRLFREYWQPIRNRLETIGNPEFLKNYNQLEAADKAFQGMYSKVKARTNALFHGKGREFSHSELRQMGQVLSLEGDPANWKAVAKSKGIDLTDAQLNTMSDVRTIFDTYGKRFGVPLHEWITNYNARIAKLSNEDFKTVIGKDPMKRVQGKQSPNEIDAFFEHARIEDYTQGRFEDNIESILDTYLRMGLRKDMIGPALQNVKNTIDALPKDISSSAKEGADLLYKSANQVAGRIYSSERAEEVTKRVIRLQDRADQILKGEGKWASKTPDQRAEIAAKTLNQNYTAFTQSLVTSSLMAFKMKMPIRNVAQVWNIGSTMAGSEYILRGQRLVGNTEEAVKTYKEFYDLGIIKPRFPVETLQLNASKFIDTINKHGLNNFYHSDDYTRIVMGTAMRERFRDSLSLYSRGELDLDSFIKATKASWLDESEQAKFVQLLKKKDYYAAESLMMRRGVQMTMFEYDIINKPEKLNSGIGKIWGQYGTYPSQYLQFLLRGAKTEGAAFLAKLGIATATVGLYYSDILGIKGMAINPTQTMMFGGSPAFGAITDLSNQMQSGELDPKALAETASIGVPLYGIGRSAWKGFEDIAEGQYMAGLIRMSGATPQEERQVPELYDNLQNILP